MTRCLEINFTNILRAAFAPIFMCSKSANLKLKKNVRKSLAENVGEIDKKMQM